MLDEELKSAILSEPADTTALDQRVMQRVRAEGARHPERWFIAVAGIAAVLIAGVASWNALFPSRGNSVFAAAAHDHHIELVDMQPRKWRTDTAGIAELAAREGLSAAQLSALVPADYHLDEGKRCRLGDRVYLHLVYSSGDAKLSVFVSGHPQAPDRTVQSSQIGEEHIAGFAAQNLEVLFVTGRPGGEAGRVAARAATLL